jgi:hypothetical protein
MKLKIVFVLMLSFLMTLSYGQIATIAGNSTSGSVDVCHGDSVEIFVEFLNYSNTNWDLVLNDGINNDTIFSLVDSVYSMWVQPDSSVMLSVVSIRDTSNVWYQSSAFFAVIINYPPDVSLSLLSNVSCYGGNDGEASVGIVSGVFPFDYFWSNGDTLAHTSSLSVGTHYVAVQDNNGCVTFDSVLVSQPVSPLALQLDSIKHIACNSNNDGYLSVSVYGGTVPYLYYWNTGQNTTSISNLSAGYHNLAVIDANGCIVQDSFLINGGVNAPSLTFNLPSDVCYDNGPILLDPLLSVTPNNAGQLLFFGSGIAGSVFYPSTVSGVTVSITAIWTDSLTGCQSSISKLIKVHSPPTVNFNLALGQLCENSGPLFIPDGTPIGGVVYGNGLDTNQIFYPSIVGPGTHQVFYEYTDVYGCVAVASDNIIVASSSNVLLSTPTTQLCNGSSPIYVNVSPSGGYCTFGGLALQQVDSVTFKLDPSLFVQGTYDLVYNVMDGGCLNSDTIGINILQSPSVTLTSPSYNLNISDLPIYLSINPPGGSLKVNGNLSGVVFDPAYWGLSVGLGHLVTYEYSNGICSSIDSIRIVVQEPMSVQLLENAGISIYPNPVHNILNIDVFGFNPTMLNVYDVSGKLVASKEVSNLDKISIDLSYLETGMYIARFVLQDGQISEDFKVLKQ